MPAETRTTGALEHAVRGQLTVLMGEIELVLAQPDVSEADRRASADRALDAVLAVERLIRGLPADPDGEQP